MSLLYQIIYLHCLYTDFLIYHSLYFGHCQSILTGSIITEHSGVEFNSRSIPGYNVTRTFFLYLIFLNSPLNSLVTFQPIRCSMLLCTVYMVPRDMGRDYATQSLVFTIKPGLMNFPTSSLPSRKVS